MKKIIILAILGIFLISGCIEEKPIGGERDEYGCLGPAGYTWNPEVGACIREWELNENQQEAAKIAVEYIGYEKGTTVLGVDVARCPGCFAVHLEKGKDRIDIALENWEIKVACPEDAKICPDGTVVVRVGPDCEFAPCPGEKEGMADDTGATPEGVSSVVNASNQFALELYSEYRNDPQYKDGNIFFSPYSISVALAMTYEGARGETAEEMQSVFHFPEDASIRGPSFARIYNQINKEDKKYELNTANALWAQQDYRFLDEYFNLIQRYYGGKVTNLDFVGETEKSRQIINSWVENKTKNKIKDLIPQGAIGKLTRLVLTNAIYFKGTWLTQFNESETRDEDFRLSPDNTVKVPMMRIEDKSEFNYAETDNIQILELPYEDEELSMLILLPKDDNLEFLENSLSVDKLAEWKDMLSEQEVKIYIPRFKFETKYFMAETLMKMGMPTAFSGNADFSGMDGTQDLFISNVIHQAFVEVNEEGTEAAAATAVIMELTAMPEYKVFRADHPFIFIIQDQETGNILFLGRVSDPS